jgi:PAS domain S-box-containing protein
MNSTAFPTETEQRLRDMNEALLVSSVHQHELTEQAEKAEAAMAESGRRFREMIDALPAAIYTTDAKGRLTHFNPACVEFSGRTPELGTDQWCVSWKLYHADGTPMPHDQCPMAIALKEGRIVRGAEAIIERPDGSRRWFTPYPTPLRDAEGKIVGGVNMLVDITERKRAEAATAALAAIVESSDDAIISKDLNGVITSWNKSAERLFGYSAQEAVGRSITILIPPDRRHEEPEILARLKRGERMDHFETVRVRKDGSRLEISLTISPLKDSTGRVIGASKIARDITERKRAVNELRASEDRFRALFESVPVAVYSCNAAGVIQEFNRRAAELWGREPAAGDTDERFCGSFKLFRPDGSFMPHEQCPMAEVVAGKIPAVHDAEVLIERPDGSRVTVVVNIQPLKNQHGAVMGAINCFYDITERKRAERALRESETRFRQLADAMPQIVWAARPDGYTDYYNQRWYEYTGFAERYGQESWEPILHPEDVQRCVETYFGCIRSGEPYQIEYRFKDRFNGGYRWFMGRALPIKNEEGRIVRWFGTCTDIDDVKQAEETLKEMDRRKNEFLATLAHELRNPLAPILNAVQVLGLKSPPDPDFQWGHALIERQVKQLSRLVDDLLDVSRISLGKINLQTEPVDLAAVVRQAIEISRPLIDAHNHHLEVSLPRQITPVEGDPVRLAQVVSNLLNNAAKYTEDGGRIDLAVEENAGEAVIRVRDTGVGIPPAMLPHIFKIFTQVQDSMSRSEGGLGIGLSLVSSLVKMHGGSVQAFSGGIGQGSEFIVRLPLLQEAFQATRATERNGEKRRTPPRHILVVDDNKDAAESLAVLLRLVGHDVRMAHSGPAALDAAQKRAPDVVLLDIGLPKMDGLEVARRLRQDLGLTNVLLVALTGYGQEDIRNRTQEAGFNAHLVKPVDLNALQGLLAHPELLRGSQAAR